MRNRDDTSNSKLAKNYKYQNPSCANYTFVDLFGDRLVNRNGLMFSTKTIWTKNLLNLML